MQQIKQIPRKVLGNTKQEVSRIGLGCMTLKGTYGQGLSDEEGLNLIKKALDQGQNFFDTAYIYLDSEELLAKAIKKYGREKFFIATKVPPMEVKLENGEMKFIPLPGNRETILKHCDLSLQRLGIDQIDLYYQHRVDPTIPIEEQAGAFKYLIEQGKIKHYGLSEVSEETIRRAHKVHPVSAIQEEYSLQTRDIENNGVLKTCKELGIAVVCYSPLGRGFLSGNFKKEQLEKEDYRNQLPRFQEEQLEKNQIAVDRLKEIANKLQVTPSQVALAWLLAQGDNIFPIPGTKREKYLVENQNAASLQLSQEIIKEIDQLFPYNSVVGERYQPEFLQMCNVSTVKQ